MESDSWTTFIYQFYKWLHGKKYDKNACFLLVDSIRNKMCIYFKKTVSFQAEVSNIWLNTLTCTNKHINFNGAVYLLFLY
jgi:hypothetical protein